MDSSCIALGLGLDGNWEPRAWYLYFSEWMVKPRRSGYPSSASTFTSMTWSCRTILFVARGQIPMSESPDGGD